MKIKDFYKWLDTVEVDYYERVEISENLITVTFCDIDFPTEEEVAKELAIKACQDLLNEPYVLQGNVYEDTTKGLRNALKILKGFPL